MSEKNIVRDRTLILRVLVPGLHTSLNDKINAKKEGDDAVASSSSSSAAASSHQRMSADQVLNLNGVSCLPSSSDSTLWHFRCDGATYPARLVNLPCPLEIHKTYDHSSYHKAADVGQMLIVYEDENVMDEAETEKTYTVEGFPSYYHSGLTPPMQNVVKRRYLSRFEERDTKPIPPPKSEVSEVEKELQELIAKLSTGKGKQKKTGAKSSSAAARDKVIEVVEDEIVDYEPWMGEGGKFTVEDAKMHPEWFLSKAELKEIELNKKEAEEEIRRKEQEAEAARLAEEEARLKEEARKAEKKEKKKKKKKKQKQEEEAAAAAAGDGKKKGIASLKNRDSGPKEEIDEVTAAAMMINEGDGVDDLLFGGDGDDMFDFDNEDISDLLG